MRFSFVGGVIALIVTVAALSLCFPAVAQTQDSLSNIVDSTGTEFASIFGSAINNAGTVTFIADRDSGGKGLYAKVSGQSDITAVVRTGDSFQGSTIADVFFFQGLADDSNTLAFQYRLANGVVGIGRARVVVIPEPGSVVLFGTGLALFGGVLVRRRK